MNDLTLLYYTANRISRQFGDRVRCVLTATTSAPLVIVSQNGSPFEELEGARFASRSAAYIHVGDRPPSIWQVYQNILVGAKAAKTAFVACVEDDSLYTAEHFEHRPALDTFAYNINRWVITRRLSAVGIRREAIFYWRNRTQMAQCIAPRELLIETLEERFAKYPTPVPHDIAKKTGWGEPGRYEKNLGLTRRRLEHFRTAQPNVTFNHGESLMGRRKVQDTDLITTELAPWGNADELWRRIHG